MKQELYDPLEPTGESLVDVQDVLINCEETLQFVAEFFCQGDSDTEIELTYAGGNGLHNILVAVQNGIRKSIQVLEGIKLTENKAKKGEEGD